MSDVAQRDANPNTCDRCKWFGEETPTYGSCRFNTPAMVPPNNAYITTYGAPVRQASWPWVANDDWCGQFSDTPPVINTTAPSCSVTCSAAQSLIANTPLKINFDTAEFNVANGFDLVNHWFKPNVAGYYQINLGVGIATSANTTYCSIYKNGVEYRRSSAGSNSVGTRISGLVHMNGTTDYVEAYLFANANETTVTSGIYTAFSASLTQAG